MPAPRKASTQPRSKGTAKRIPTGQPGKAVEPAGPVSPTPPKDLLPESLEAWDAVWLMPQASSFVGAHRVVVLRWVKALDAWFRGPVC